MYAEASQDGCGGIAWGGRTSYCILSEWGRCLKAPFLSSR